MEQNQLITKGEFLDFYDPLLKGYTETFKNHVASKEILGELLFPENDKIAIVDFHNIASNDDDSFIKSFLYRLLVILRAIPITN